MGPDPRPKRVRLRRPLPTAAYDSRRTGTERVAMTRNGQRLLMLIDDEPAQRRLVSALAARGGWRSVFAADAEMAIAMLGTQDGMQLDAIVLDIWSPDDDAAGLIADLRARRPALPILMLTAHAPEIGSAPRRARVGQYV